MPKQSTNILSRGRNRRVVSANAMIEPAPLIAQAAVYSGANLLILMDRDFMLSGIPQYRTTGVNGGLPVSAEKLPDRYLRLVYAATQAASVTCIVPVSDPAVRTYQGGFVAPQVLTCEPP